MNILFVTIIVAIVVGLMIAMKLIQTQPGKSAGYENRGNLFTPAERSFMGVLEQALDSRYRVFGKVRLGDLIKPANGLAAGKRTTALNRINQKHVDFVVCTANELSPVGVLELDDQSHSRGDRAGRDEIVDQALAMAGIPMLRFPAKNGYAVQDVRARLGEMMLAGTKSGVVSMAQKDIATFNPALDAIMESNPVQPRFGCTFLPEMFGEDGETAVAKRESCREVFLGVFDFSHVQAGGGDRVSMRLASRIERLQAG